MRRGDSSARRACVFSFQEGVMLKTRRVLAALSMMGTLATFGCHHEVEVPPLPEQKISLLGDRFFDVKALSADHVLVAGYRGKILETTDNGRSWNIIQTPTDRA